VGRASPFLNNMKPQFQTHHFQVNFSNGYARESVLASDHLSAWGALFKLLGGHMTRKGQLRKLNRQITSIDYLGLS
jgi:hypothetical protein